MIIFARESTLGNVVKNLVEKILTDANSEVKKLYEAVDLGNEVKSLRAEIAKLEIQESQINEKYAKREREIEHKLGLEKTRQVQDLEFGLREQKVKLQEENLTLDRKRFEENMKFTTDRFSTEVTYLKDMIQKLVPKTSININKEV